MLYYFCVHVVLHKICHAQVLHEAYAILLSHLSAVLGVLIPSSFTSSCGTFVSLLDGALYNTTATQGQLHVENSACPRKDNSSSSLPSPHQHHRQLLQKKIYGNKHILVGRDDAIEVFVYDEQQCERREQLSVNGTPQACIDDSFNPLKVLCVVYDRSHQRVEVYDIASPSTPNETWTMNFEPFWETPYTIQLTHPYIFRRNHIHLIFGAGHNLVHTTFYSTHNIDPPPGLGSIRELYVLNSEELLIDFGASAYIYSLSSAQFAAYITAPLADLVITDFVLTTNGNGTVTIFNNSFIQFTMSANRCAFMQSPNSTQVEHVEIFNGTVLLALVTFGHHSVLYKIAVESIKGLLSETAESCKNISFEDVSAPLLSITNAACLPRCTGFTVNDPLLLVDSCNRSSVDVYVFDGECAVRYVGTMEGVTTCELEPFAPLVDPSQCVHALAVDSDNGNTSVSTESQTIPSPTPSSGPLPLPSLPPPSPDVHSTPVMKRWPVIIGVPVALALVVAIFAIVVFIICMYWHCIYSKKCKGTLELEEVTSMSLSDGGGNGQWTTN